MAVITAMRGLSSEQTAQALRLIATVTEADGLAPLSEHVLLHLRHGGDERGLHFLAMDGDELVGFGHLDRTDEVNGPSAELAVDPRHRRCGIGRALVTEMAQGAGGRLRLWAHGELAPANALARSLGYTDARVLWQMRRSLLAELPAPSWPEGIRLRTFLPEIDDDAWIDLNHRAFAGHPEQGRWTLADLRRRMAEPWFSASGFLIAESEADGRMAGFHWTKVHGAVPQHGATGDDHHDHDHHHDPIGEVYVVGVDPAWQGHGLGRALTIAGLASMRALGLRQAMLYVEATNAPAIALYESLGFARWDTDVLYQVRPTT